MDNSPVYMSGHDGGQQNQYYGLPEHHHGDANMASGTDLGKHSVLLIYKKFRWSIRLLVLS